MGDASLPDAIVLAQFDKAGAPDDDFGGGDGFVVTDFGAAVQTASGVAVDSKGKVYVAGTFDGPGDDRFLLARYTKEGSLDVGFNAGGAFLTEVNAGAASAEQVAGLGVQKGGNVVVAGNAGPNAAVQDLALVRYSDDLGPSGSARLRKHTLLVDGTDEDDVISVSLVTSRDAIGSINGLNDDDEDDDEDDDQLVQVVVNGGTPELFEADDVRVIDVDADEGDDEVTVTDVTAGDVEFCVIFGDRGDDTLRVTGNLDCELRGEKGDDRLFGGDGDDDLIGGGGDDRMSGGDGDDFFFAFDGEEDDIDGGDGEDVADADLFDETASVSRL